MEAKQQQHQKRNSDENVETMKKKATIKLTSFFTFSQHSFSSALPAGIMSTLVFCQLSFPNIVR